MNWPYVSVSFISLVNAAVGVYVFLNKPSKPLNRAFLAFALGLAAIGAGMAALAASHILFFDRVIFLGGLLMIFGFVLLLMKFPRDQSIAARIWLTFLPLVDMVVSVPFGFFVEKVIFHPNGTLEPVNGPGIHLFIILISAYVLFGAFQFGLNYRISSGRSRLQMRYLATGIGTFISVTLICNVILPAFGIFEFNLLGPASSSVFVMLTAYAMVRHELLSIQTIVHRGIVYLIIISLLAGLFIAAMFSLEVMFGISLDKDNAATIGIGFAVACLGVFAAVASEKSHTKRKMDLSRRNFEASLADMSHGLQTPLAIMKIKLHSIRNKAGTSRHMDAFEKSIDNVSRFTYGLLELARLSASDRIPPRTHVNLSGLLEDFAEYFQTLADQKRASLILSIESGIWAKVNKEQFMEIVANLASNALKYLKKDRPGEIRLGLHNDKGRVVFEIQDNGRGIAPSQLENIFERFHRGSEAGPKSPSGTGLGLAITKKIVECYKGDISIESRVGFGTRVIVKLPSAANGRRANRSG